MAIRLINVHRHPLRIDLREGEPFVLEKGGRSPPLREELLYDNAHLAEWERAGWVVRVRASMKEVLEHEARGEAAPVPAAAPKGRRRGKDKSKDSTKGKRARGKGRSGPGT